MRFLRRQLAQHVAADGVGEEGFARAPEDRNEPRQHQHQRPHQAPYQSQPPQPGCTAIEDRERDDRQRDEHQDQRSLQQHAAGQCRPEDSGPTPGRMLGILAPLPGQIDPRQCAHRGDDRKQQHRIGFRQSCFDAKQHRTAHHQRGEHGRAPCHERQRRPIGQKHRANCTDQRGDAIHPDPQFRARQAER